MKLHFDKLKDVIKGVSSFIGNF